MTPRNFHAAALSISSRIFAPANPACNVATRPAFTLCSTVTRTRWLFAVLLAFVSIVAQAATFTVAHGGDVQATGQGSQDTDVALDTPPSVTKKFHPARIGIGGLSNVTITLINTNSMPAVLTGELDDFLPSHVVIADGSATTCANGNVSAISGFAVFALGLGAEIPAQGACTIVVQVTADALGTYTNTIPAGALQTNKGANADPGSAILTVADLIFADGFDDDD